MGIIKIHLKGGKNASEGVGNTRETKGKGSCALTETLTFSQELLATVALFSDLTMLLTDSILKVNE